MLTLHIEAESIEELAAKTLAALGLKIDQPTVDTALSQPFKEEAPKRGRKKAEVTLTPEQRAAALDTTTVTFPKIEPDDEHLRKQFETLVSKDYDAALSILDTLGVANFKEAVTKGMAPQIKLAMEAFA